MFKLIRRLFRWALYLFIVVVVLAVAAGASSHFVVTKRTAGGRTLSEITLLDRPGRVRELTRMLGGQTEAARRHAEELLRFTQA